MIKLEKTKVLKMVYYCHMEETVIPGGNVFYRTGTIFKHDQVMIGTTILSKFHDDWTTY